MQFTTITYLLILFILNFFTIFHLILWFEVRNKLKRKPLSNSELPNVSVIVPTYNEGKLISTSLKKLLSINYPRNKYEVLVIDDGSTDDTYEIAKKFQSKNIRVFKKKNSGKAASMNFGIKMARYDYVAIMDADSFLEKNSLRQCMAYFDEYDVAAVTSHILVKRQTTIWEKLQQAEYMIVSVFRKAQEHLNLISVTPGPLSVYNKKILVKVGGFDEKNLVEDVEIDWRLLKNGYKIRMAFDAIVHSFYPDNLKWWWKQRTRWTIGGIQTFFKYLRFIFDKKAHNVGRFIVPISLLVYVLSLLGIIIFMYLTATRAFAYFLYLTTSLSFGINPFSNFDISYNVDLLVIYGILIFLFSLYTIRLSTKVHKEDPSIPVLAIFLTLYPILLTINLLTSIYKFLRNERGWMTK
ncbi:MAG: glycosyltransferase family 2 protein [Candidatus Aenigmarchaeota archaeon]|nr:glycosyltransferase family 2 protein [Candidatus Aenigmarchaeota archaeon]